MPRGVMILAGVVIAGAVFTVITQGDTGADDLPFQTTAALGREDLPAERLDEDVMALPPAQTLEVDGVEWSIQPLSLDTEGAMFSISIDTHAGDLDMDVARLASLEIGGITWGPGRWEGAPPGGHHRQGQLRFDASGPLDRQMTLVLDLAPTPVIAVWELTG